MSADITQLPESSLVPFLTQRIRSPTIVLRNMGVNDGMTNDAEILGRCAWLVPDSRDLPALSDDTKEFRAERYGGAGIGMHGGGVRCGLDDTLQVKGLGCNCLAGVGVPKDYTHGGMSISDGIQEAIWSEVCRVALPFKSARTLAVLGTGTQCWWVFERWGAAALEQRYGTPPNLPRGLIVREAALRPAHFERATLFQSQPVTNMGSDSERVRRAIARLPQLLPVRDGQYGKNNARLMDILTTGFVEMARRFGTQSAAAKSKRLIHGNITSSNICLDGRWIDFGSATAIPGWGEAYGYGPFWDDRELYSTIFWGLAFYASKYLEGFAGSPEELAMHAATSYVSAHDEWLTRRFAAMTGVPYHLLQCPDVATAASHLSVVLRKVAKSGYAFPNSAHPDEHAKFGAYRIGEMMMELAATSGTTAAQYYSQLQDNTPLCEELKRAHANVWNAACFVSLPMGIQPKALRLLMTINSAKVAKQLKLLYREYLVRETEQLILRSRSPQELREAAQGLLSGIRAGALILFEDPTSHTSTVWLHGDERLYYDAVVNKFLMEKDHGSSAAKKALSLDDDSEIMSGARNFWGSDIWEKFHARTI